MSRVGVQGVPWSGGPWLVASLLLTVVACGGGERGDAEASGDATDRVAELADVYVAGYFEANPHEATELGLADAAHGRLPDNSLAARAEWQAQEDQLLAQLVEIDPASLEGRPEAITYGFLRDKLEAEAGFRECRMELWNVSPTWTGWQSQFALLASIQPVETAEDRAVALERFGQLPTYLDTEIDNLREGVRLGYTAPANNVETVIEQMDGLLAAPVSASPFVGMAREDMPDFRRELKGLVEGEIRPAIQRYRDFLQDEYLPAARAEVGVNANPGGADCYLNAIRLRTTLEIPPEEIHETGLREMETILAEMRLIGKRSFGTDDPQVLLDRLRSDPEYLFGGREELIAYAENAVDRAEAVMPDWFGRLPEAEVIVEPYPAFQEKTAPAGFYTAPAEDGSRPGIYLINAYQADEQSKAGLEATAFHETYPGHHLQNAVAMERGDLHPISRYLYLSGFGEGWALYSERLADEMGLYTSDVDLMGLLSNEALRAGRLVVDSGMHAMGWTRQQAIDYLLANTALSEAQATSEIDRYIAVPGQATSYMLGNLEIRRLREEAESALGDSFDIRAFHDRVLEDGSVPLPMLREKIEVWIDGSDNGSES